MYKAFIFDFDGVLVDTTDIQVRSIVRALGRRDFNVRHPSDLEIVNSTITTKAKLSSFVTRVTSPWIRYIRFMKTRNRLQMN